LKRDLFSGDDDELALTLLDIVAPLHYPLSVLHKARRHALASLLLVASEEMPPLESADRHPTPSQKLPTSKQPTPLAAPALATPLSSASIAPSPLSLNLLPINPPSQTGDSYLVAYTTIDSSRKEKGCSGNRDRTQVAKRQICWSKSRSRRLFHQVNGGLC